jgi:hypothetical protein
VKGQDVRNAAARVLFGQRIIALGEYTVQRLSQFRKPGHVQVVKDPGIDAGPIVNGHGEFSVDYSVIVPSFSADGYDADVTGHGFTASAVLFD